MIGESLALKLLSRLGLYRPMEQHYKMFEVSREKCESPIEILFWNTAYFELSKFGEFSPQMPVGPYRVDFTLTEIPDAPLVKIAIEIDGHDGHKTKSQRDHDTQRERYLLKNRWRVIRFTGGQVYRDAARCVEEAKELIAGYIYWEATGGR